MSKSLSHLKHDFANLLMFNANLRNLFIYLCIYLCIYLFADLFVCLFIYLFLFIYSFIHLFEKLYLRVLPKFLEFGENLIS